MFTNRNFTHSWTKSDTRFLYTISICIVFFFSFEDKILSIIEREISSPYTRNLEYSIITIILILIIAISLLIIKAPKLIRFHRFTSYKSVFLCVTIIILFSRLQYKNLFQVNFEYYKFGILDILIYIFLIPYTVLSLILNLYPKKHSEDVKKVVHSKIVKLLIDNPIQHENDDLFNYQKKVDNLLNQIAALGNDEKFLNSKSFSIGIVGKWGYGKSSFLELLKNRILSKSNDYILIQFNPRHATEITTIQLEFFKTFYNHLKEYDSRFKKSINNYLKSLYIIDKTNLSEFISSINETFIDNENEKEILNQAINRINKTIIIIIDDLDRLLADEIIEVFKIIDGTASFSNTVFITAYDKDHINQIIDTKYSNHESFFSDKFFNLEVFLPVMSAEKMLTFIQHKLETSFLHQSNNDKFNGFDLKEELKVLKPIIKEQLLTLRDIKRFLNSFHNQFYLVQKYLDFKDFFILSLLKYKYYNIYNHLQKQDISLISSIDFEGVKIPVKNFTKEELLKKILVDIIYHHFNDGTSIVDLENSTHTELLNKLTISLKTLLENLFLGEKNEKSFLTEGISSFYFEENEDINDYRYTALYFKILLDEESIVNIIKGIDSYGSDLKNTKILDYIEKYLSSQLENLESLERFYKQVNFIYYTYCKLENAPQALTLLIKICESHFFTQLIEKNASKEAELRNFYFKLITNSEYSKNATLLFELFRQIYRQTNNVSPYYFTKEQLVRIAIYNFNKYTINNKKYTQIHSQLLQCCIIDVKNNRPILDIDSCKTIRELIIKSPKPYLSNFVRLGMTTSDPTWNSITGDPFWKQIFKTPIDFENLIYNDKLDKEEYIIKVRNFWMLFKNNEYKAIEYRDDGIVQEKIDNDLQDEYDAFQSTVENFVNELINNSHTKWDELLEDTNPGHYGIDSLEINVDKSDINFINTTTGKFEIFNVALDFSVKIESSHKSRYIRATPKVNIEGDFTIDSTRKITINTIVKTTNIFLFFETED